jgi:PncC family amidohydrolase
MEGALLLLAARLSGEAIARKITVATAESCTSGLIAATIGAVPGVSAVLMGGIIAYDNRIKTQVLGVDAALLETHGAVSAPVAREMAERARMLFGTTHAVSATGIAGPGGGSVVKPVGTAFVAVASPSATLALSLRLEGNRQEIRLQTVEAALELLGKGMLHLPA